MFAGLMMSEKAWKSLSLSQQAAIERAAQRWMQFSHELSGKLKQKFITTVKKSGGEIYQLPAANEMEFRKVTKPLLERVAKISGPEGRELIAIFEKLRGE
jgi:TRAP-type C4-dicarboxylate transport system substrate-binding protein